MSRMFDLPLPLARLLVQVVSERRPELKSALDNGMELSDENRHLIQQILVDELSENGIDADGEPNDRGRHLDQLIGAFGPTNVKIKRVT